MLFARRKGLSAASGSSVPSWPYLVNFSTLPDGPLPQWFKGGNWAISDGKAYGTPTLTNLLVNGDFSDWTAGAPTGWNANATGIEQNPVGQLHIQGIKELRRTVTGPAGFYRNVLELTGYSAGSLYLNPGWAGAKLTLTGVGVGTYERFQGSEPFIVDTSAGSDLTTDNWMCQLITDNMTLVDFGRADVSAIANVTPLSSSWCGLVVRADSLTSPTNYIAAVRQNIGSGYHFTVVKCVNGVMSTLGTSAPGGTGVISIVCSGTSVKVYMDAYIAYDLTVNEPTITNNTCHGIISLNPGNYLNSFCCHSSALVKSLYQGGSNTQGDIATTQWPAKNYRNIVNNYANSNYTNIAYGGTGSWYGLVTLQTIIDSNPNIIYLEYAVNDAGDGTGGTRTNKWAPCAEAIIRRLRAALPTARIVCVNLYQDNSPSPTTASDKWNALAAKYDLDLLRGNLWLRAKLGTDTPTSGQLAPYCDGVHWTALGHTEIANMIYPHLAGWYVNPTPGWSGNLADYGDPYFADEADWEAAPTIRTGIDNDGETGTGWSTVSTTQRQSSTAGDTISWTGTFCSFGLEHGLSGSPVIRWSIDGGPETQLALGAPGYTQISNFARGVHTVTIKVVSGTVLLKKFLAV